MPSYSPVFSQGFIYYTEATPNTEFLVPEGFTAVVRDVSAFTEIGDVIFDARVYAPESGSPCIFMAGNPIGVWTSNQWSGRVVAPEGWLIAIGMSGIDSTFSCYVGGYLLRNTLS